MTARGPGVLCDRRPQRESCRSATRTDGLPTRGWLSTGLGRRTQPAPWSRTAEDAKEMEKIMKDYHELVQRGKREIYKIEG